MTPTDKILNGFFSSRATGGSALKGRVWEVAVITSGWTTHGEYYTPEVLAEAVPLYEGIPVHAYELGSTLSHLPDEMHAANPRGLVAHQVGILKNVRMGLSDNIPAMVGEIHLDSDDMAAIVTSRLSSASPPELSVDQRIRYTMDSDGRVKVMQISAAHSLDVVAAGAAGGRFLRAVASLAGVDRQNMESDMELKDIRSVDGLRQAFPELVAAVVKPTEVELSEARSTLSARDAEVKSLTEKLAATDAIAKAAEAKIAAAEKRATESDTAAKKVAFEAGVDKRVTASKIPADKVTDLFRKQLYAAQDDASVEALILDREALVTSEQRATESTVVDAGRRASNPVEDKTKGDIITSVFGAAEAK